MILAHFGMDWWPEALTFGRLLLNLYFDCSYWRLPLRAHSEECYGIPRRFIDDCGAHTVLWGTDAPLPNVLLPPKEWVDIHASPRTEVSFSKEETDGITDTSARGGAQTLKTTSEVRGMVKEAIIGKDCSNAVRRTCWPWREDR